MSIARKEVHEVETMLFACRMEAGTQAVRDRLYQMRDAANREWIGATGEELFRLQGDARTIARLIKMIEQGPTITNLGGN